MKTTVGKLHMNFEEYMQINLCSEVKSCGFTIGNGKKLYWYVVPFNGYFKCYPVEPDGLGWPRKVSGEQEITIHLIK